MRLTLLAVFSISSSCSARIRSGARTPRSCIVTCTHSSKDQHTCTQQQRENSAPVNTEQGMEYSKQHEKKSRQQQQLYFALFCARFLSQGTTCVLRKTWKANNNSTWTIVRTITTVNINLKQFQTPTWHLILSSLEFCCSASCEFWNCLYCALLYAVQHFSWHLKCHASIKNETLRTNWGSRFKAYCSALHELS